MIVETLDASVRVGRRRRLALETDNRIEVLLPLIEGERTPENAERQSERGKRREGERRSKGRAILSSAK